MDTLPASPAPSSAQESDAAAAARLATVLMGLGDISHDRDPDGNECGVASSAALDAGVHVAPGCGSTSSAPEATAGSIQLSVFEHEQAVPDHRQLHQSPPPPPPPSSSAAQRQDEQRLFLPPFDSFPFASPELCLYNSADRDAPSHATASASLQNFAPHADAGYSAVPSPAPHLPLESAASYAPLLATSSDELAQDIETWAATQQQQRQPRHQTQAEQNQTWFSLREHKMRSRRLSSPPPAQTSSHSRPPALSSADQARVAKNGANEDGLPAATAMDAEPPPPPPPPTTTTMFHAPIRRLDPIALSSDPATMFRAAAGPSTDSSSSSGVGLTGWQGNIPPQLQPTWPSSPLAGGSAASSPLAGMQRAAASGASSLSSGILPLQAPFNHGARQLNMLSSTPALAPGAGSVLMRNTPSRSSSINSRIPTSQAPQQLPAGWTLFSSPMLHTTPPSASVSGGVSTENHRQSLSQQRLSATDGYGAWHLAQVRNTAGNIFSSSTGANDGSGQGPSCKVGENRNGSAQPSFSPPESPLGTREAIAPGEMTRICAPAPTGLVPASVNKSPSLSAGSHTPSPSTPKGAYPNSALATAATAALRARMAAATSPTTNRRRSIFVSSSSSASSLLSQSSSAGGFGGAPMQSSPACGGVGGGGGTPQALMEYALPSPTHIGGSGAPPPKSPPLSLTPTDRYTAAVGIGPVGGSSSGEVGRSSAGDLNEQSSGTELTEIEETASQTTGGRTGSSGNSAERGQASTCKADAAQGYNTHPRAKACTNRPETMYPSAQAALEAMVGYHNPKTKPTQPYPNLIRLTLLTSATGRLTLSELYEAMAEHFPWFKSQGMSWKNSIRHNLSINSAFLRVEKPQRDARDKGSLWFVDTRIEPASVRPPRSSGTRDTAAVAAGGSKRSGGGIGPRAPRSKLVSAEEAGLDWSTLGVAPAVSPGGASTSPDLPPAAAMAAAAAAAASSAVSPPAAQEIDENTKGERTEAVETTSDTKPGMPRTSTEEQQEAVDDKMTEAPAEEEKDQITDAAIKKKSPEDEALASIPGIMGQSATTAPDPTPLTASAMSTPAAAGSEASPSKQRPARNNVRKRSSETSASPTRQAKQRNRLLTPSRSFPVETLSTSVVSPFGTRGLFGMDSSSRPGQKRTWSDQQFDAASASSSFAAQPPLLPYGAGSMGMLGLHPHQHHPPASTLFRPTAGATPAIGAATTATATALPGTPVTSPLADGSAGSGSNGATMPAVVGGMMPVPMPVVGAGQQSAWARGSGSNGSPSASLVSICGALSPAASTSASASASSCVQHEQQRGGATAAAAVPYYPYLHAYSPTPAAPAAATGWGNGPGYVEQGGSHPHFGAAGSQAHAHAQTPHGPRMAALSPLRSPLLSLSAAEGGSGMGRAAVCSTTPAASASAIAGDSSAVPCWTSEAYCAGCGRAMSSCVCPRGSCTAAVSVWPAHQHVAPSLAVGSSHLPWAPGVPMPTSAATQMQMQTPSSPWNLRRGGLGATMAAPVTPERGRSGAGSSGGLAVALPQPVSIHSYTRPDSTTPTPAGSSANTGETAEFSPATSQRSSRLVPLAQRQPHRREAQPQWPQRQMDNAGTRAVESSAPSQARAGGPFSSPSWASRFSDAEGEGCDEDAEGETEEEDEVEAEVREREEQEEDGKVAEEEEKECGTGSADAMLAAGVNRYKISSDSYSASTAATAERGQGSAAVSRPQTEQVAGESPLMLRSGSEDTSTATAPGACADTTSTATATGPGRQDE
ncbi:hypothetical protein OC842_001625 [Tilletia horrida]|uniref:Fork-head domain-containing protein n=1 Tax=Tilletia horrida TaxID=155126 RepID=A0AAN6GHG6_9BASI|nr:hypothetical protein OC842_001625 [Tilletia horrida]